MVSDDWLLGSVESVESVDPDAPLADHLRADTLHAFCVPSLRPKQEEVITTIIADPKCEGKLLVVDRTGGGKSLILFLTAFAISGVPLIIVPLYSPLLPIKSCGSKDRTEELFFQGAPP